jgi:hypothetical protein
VLYRDKDAGWIILDLYGRILSKTTQTCTINLYLESQPWAVVVELSPKCKARSFHSPGKRVSYAYEDV